MTKYEDIGMNAERERQTKAARRRIRGYIAHNQNMPRKNKPKKERQKETKETAPMSEEVVRMLGHPPRPRKKKR